jgi:tetratricopeptide (TPR) repeat protein
MEASSPPTSSRKRGSHRRNRRRFVIVGAVALVIFGVIGLGVWSGLKGWRQARTVKRAEELLKKEDYVQAAMSATWALQLDPQDVEATKLMAAICAAQGQRQELAWRARLVELQPDSLEPRLAWATAALNHQEVSVAQDALAGVSDEQKKSVSYHAVAGRLAAVFRQKDATEKSVRETIRLDPGNELYQLELASLRLGSEKGQVRELARDEIEQLAASAKVARPALIVLIRDAMLRGDAARALAFSEKLNASPVAKFEDRLQYLRLLRQLNRREFWWCLAQVQAEVIGDNKELPALMTYLNKSGFPNVSVEWSKSFGEETRKVPLVSVALAESYAMMKDWEGLKVQVKFSGWGSLEFQRLALLARVAREQGDLPGASANWRAAGVAAAGRTEDLTTLIRLATAWKWTEEANSVLWQLARGPTDQMPALQALSRNYQINGRTRELLDVANRMIEIDPRNTFGKNNAAYLSLLLEVDKERAHVLAKEVYASDPKNPAFVATYAFAMHFLGKTEEGLKLMRLLQAKDREVPANAFCYGVLLAAANHRDEAVKYLNIAETSSILFPQEKALLAKAREWTAKP